MVNLKPFKLAFSINSRADRGQISLSFHSDIKNAVKFGHSFLGNTYIYNMA